MRIKLCGEVTNNNYARFYKWFGLEACCPNDVRNAIENCPEDEELVLEINSGGGSVYAGFEMYNVIRSSGRRVKAEIQSIAGSAMSVVICACDEVLISPVANIMIHRSAISTQGNADVHKQRVQLLTTIDETFLNAYTEKAGEKCTRTKFRHMIDNETFMTPQDAIDCGLADGLLSRPGEEAENGEALDPTLAAASVENMNHAILKHLGIGNQLPSIEDMMQLAREQGLNIDHPDGEGVQNKTKTEESETHMDVQEIKTTEELQANFPEMVAQIQAEAAAAERGRINAIEGVALPGFEDIVAAAKADPTMNAGDVATAIIAKQKAQGTTYLNTVRQEAKASGVNNVTAEAEPVRGEEEDNPDADAKAAMELFVKGGAL